jgi:hypothetical protein
MVKWNKAISKGIAEFAIVLATIQLSPLILPASQNKVLAFTLPLLMLILAIVLLKMED